MKKFLSCLLSLIAGTFVGFFVVFNSVFSDSTGFSGERIFTFVLVIAVYGILGFALGMLAPGRSLFWSFLTCLPAAAILFWYTAKEQGIIIYSIVYLILAFLSVFTAAYLSDGSRYGRR